MDRSERSPVPTGDPNLRIEPDPIGRAYWANDGSRITWTDVLECDEDGEPKHELVDALIRNGLWVLHGAREALVTWDGIEAWLDEAS